MTATTPPTLCADGTRAHRMLLDPPSGTSIPGHCVLCSYTRIYQPFADEDLKGKESAIRHNNYAAKPVPSKTPLYVSGTRSYSSGKRARRD